MAGLEIDVNDLIGECAVQAELFRQAGVRFVTASGKAKRAKLALDLHESASAREIRRDPEKYGATKVTEGAIQELVKTNGNTITLREDLIEAEEVAAKAKVEYEAWMQRASLLRGEVELLSFHYTQPDRESRGKGAQEVQEKKIGAGRARRRASGNTTTADKKG